MKRILCIVAVLAVALVGCSKADKSAPALETLKQPAPVVIPVPEPEKGKPAGKPVAPKAPQTGDCVDASGRVFAEGYEYGLGVSGGIAIFRCTDGEFKEVK